MLTFFMQSKTFHAKIQKQDVESLTLCGKKKTTSSFRPPRRRKMKKNKNTNKKSWTLCGTKEHHLWSSPSQRKKEETRKKEKRENKRKPPLISTLPKEDESITKKAPQRGGIHIKPPFTFFSPLFFLLCWLFSPFFLLAPRHLLYFFSSNYVLFVLH